MTSEETPRYGQDSAVRDEAAATDDWADDPVLPRYSTSTYGADYPVESLTRRISTDPDNVDADIFIPSFQRGYVWGKPQADRFIESLLLGLPVPGIFLWKDPLTERLAVIDGSQRLRTLKFYYDGVIRGKEFSLDNVHEDFQGRTYKSLTHVDRRRLDDSIIHANVVRQDDPSDDNSSIFYIFQRINTGGSPAQPQEIRNAIYQGTFNDLLRELDRHESWRSIYGVQSNRRKDQELVLRFLALYHGGDKYESPMKEFLNRFMRSHRNPSQQDLHDYRQDFTTAIDFVMRTAGRRAFRPERTLNAAVFDAVMVGVARRLARGPVADEEAGQRAYDTLLQNEEFRDATTTGTSQEQNVQTRLEMAENAFAAID